MIGRVGAALILFGVAAGGSGACSSNGGTDRASFCAAFDDLAGSDPFGADATATPAEMEASFARLRRDIAAVSAAAPDEAGPPASRYLDSVDRLVELLDGVGYDPRHVDQLDYAHAVEGYGDAARSVQQAANALCERP